MTISELEQIIPMYMDNENAPAIMLVSEAGIGKSSLIEQIGKKYGYRVHIFRGAEHDAVDLIGMPEIVKDEKGNSVTKFIAPDWVPKWDEKFIFFADEINRARIDVRQACFRIAEMRGTETWKINRKNHMVIMAVNPDDGNFQVEALDLAFLNRPSIFKLEPSISDFAKWAFSAEIDENIISFLQANNNYLYIKPANDYGISQYPTPRSWANASALTKKFQLKTGEKLPENILTLLVGNVGIEAASAFATYMEDKDPPLTITEILDKLDDKLIEKFKKHQSKNDSITKAIVSILNLTAYIQSKELTEKQWKNISKLFDNIISEEIKVTFAKNITSDKLDTLFKHINIDDIISVAKSTHRKKNNMK